MRASPYPGSPGGSLAWRTFAIASVAVFLVSLDATVLYAAFPALRHAFPSASTAELSWILNAYTVVFAALLVPAGRLADLRGRKKVFVTGAGLFLVASAACGLAPTEGFLVGARVVQAIGAALLLPSSLAIVLAAFPSTKRAVVVSLWGAVSGLAAAVGPSLGTLLVQHLGWESAFLINVPIGGVALYYAVRTLDESKNPATGAPLDLVGVALVVVGIGAIAFGLVRSEAADWPATVAALAAGSSSLIAYVAWARRTPSPAIDLSLFRHRTYRYVNLATLAFGIGFAMMFFSVFQFLTGVWGYSLSQAGIAFIPGPLLVIPTSIVCGRIAARAGHRRLIAAGGLVFAAGALWIATVPTAEPAYLTTWLPGSILTGIGVGMVLPSLSAAAVAKLPPSQFGVGSAINQAVRQIGSVLGVALAVVIVGTAPSFSSFETVFHWQAGFAVLTALLALPVDTRPSRP